MGFGEWNGMFTGNPTPVNAAPPAVIGEFYANGDDSADVAGAFSGRK